MFGIITKPERMELNPATETDLDLAQFAKKANDVLGYSVLKTQLGQGVSLAYALRELEIEPFDPEQVATYKEKMREKWNKKTFETRGRRFRYDAHWQRLSLAGYPLPVPEYVLAKAMEIKEKLPSATFHVDQLVVHAQEIQEVKYPDPFLVAVCGGEEFFVEFWDEPEFEGLR